jgi:hypothetical protein
VDGNRPAAQLWTGNSALRTHLDVDRHAYLAENVPVPRHKAMSAPDASGSVMPKAPEIGRASHIRLDVMYIRCRTVSFPTDSPELQSAQSPNMSDEIKIETAVEEQVATHEMGQPDIEEGKLRHKANNQMDDAAKILEEAGGSISYTQEDQKRLLRKIDLYVALPMCLVYFIQQVGGLSHCSLALMRRSSTSRHSPSRRFSVFRQTPTFKAPNTRGLDPSSPARS